MKVRCVALAVAIVVAVWGAVPAGAAPWQRLTTPDGSSTDQVGLVRSADGVLHVAWHHRTGPNTEDLNHTVISRAGRIGATSPIQSGWTGFTNTALVVEPGGLRAFWGGFRSTDSSDPQRETNTALSSDGGASWALLPGQVNPSGAQSYASSHAATVRKDGSTLQAFAGTLGTWVHAGLSPATPNHNYMEGRQYGNDPNLATDSADRTVMAWYSSATGQLGVLAQDVGADGSPVGGPLTMPGTGAMNTGMLARTPLAARKGGGFYTAYPTPGGVRVWRLGAAQRAGPRPHRRQPGGGDRGSRRRTDLGPVVQGFRRSGRAGAALEQERDQVRRDRERGSSAGRAAGLRPRRERRR